MSFKKTHFIIFLNLFLYKTLLHISYVNFVYKNFEYMGFTYDFSMYKYIISIILLILTFIFVPKNNSKASSFFLQLHFIIMIIPMFVIYYSMNKSTNFMLASAMTYIIQCLIVKYVPLLNIKKIKYSKIILYIMIFTISTFVYVSMIKSNGIPKVSTLNILNVYDLRKNVNYPFLMVYLVNWQAKVINPFLITISYMKRKKIKTAIFIAIQIIIYMITGHKAYLFIPIAIILIMKFIRKADILKIISKMASLSTLSLYLIYLLSNSILLPSIFLRRFLLLPAYIKFLYYDFFSKNGYIFFSAGSLGKLFNITYPYDLSPAYLIGDIFFNNPETGANAGYLADAYANMGIPGMIIIGVFFALILKVIDSLGEKIGKEITVGLSLFLMLSLNDSAFLTTLLTGGLLFLILLLYLYSSNKNYLNMKKRCKECVESQGS